MINEKKIPKNIILNDFYFLAWLEVLKEKEIIMIKDKFCVYLSSHELSELQSQYEKDGHKDMFNRVKSAIRHFNDIKNPLMVLNPKN